MTYAKRVLEPRRVLVDGNGWQELAWRGEHESQVEVGVWRDATRQAGYVHPDKIEQGRWRRCAAVQWMQGLLCLGSDTHDRIT
ncbi:BZ3500_MvSof-1268-A1-R1_Chr3-1g06006 [Microbotryum saponariae]|uniref:BZ3500_MvSof-1268-A1-R1_Chr3-1g06006 protein n=1 Tax=Microbotryum saponariae TaxID=289078 RepID=A0A2X0LSX7_9BASI|nr:BZ3500_MvSof-1268-A1-R1_Chr3-1g06006 [Microbotryum saponariae]SDA05196.1 BZ3501_MvSof-1269-A2-R1_Chr3-1g05676 [Microbotryum saponariae]